jgi:hypothetical protein
MDETTRKYLMAVRNKGKTHATQKEADYTYCGLECRGWEHWKKTDGADVDCNRCRKSLGLFQINVVGQL